MTTLVYVKDTMPPQFKSLGSPVFPKGKIYTLGGKFPLKSYLDLYVNSGIPHTLNGVPVKLIGFDNSCSCSCKKGEMDTDHAKFWLKKCQLQEVEKK
jgi:hypothetical protein